MAVGEIGRLVNLAEHEKLDKTIFGYFSNASDDLKSVAALAMGRGG